MSGRRGWPALAIVGLAAVTIGILGLTVPLSYDEGYNLQVPRHLAEAGLYATDGSVYGDNGSRTFDVFISTGPTLLLPIGGAFALFGDHLLLARAMALAGYLGLLLATAVVAARLSVRPGIAMALAVAGVMAISTQIDWPRTVVFGPADVLGEHTAAALVLWAAVMLLDRPLAGGLLLALAVLTKLLALLVLPAFVLALALSRAKRSRAMNALLFLAGLAAPVILWNLWRWVALGPTVFEARTSEFLRFTMSAGSGLASGPSDDLSSRLTLISELWHLPALPISVLALVGLSLAVRHEGRSGAGYACRVDHSTRAMVWALSSSAVILTTWWLLVSDLAYGRHLLLAPLLATPLLAGWLTSTPKTRRRGATLRTLWLGGSVVAMGVLAACVALRAHSLLEPPGPSITDQRRVAAALTETHAPQFSFLGAWWQAPDIAYISGLMARPGADPSLPLVITPLQRTLDPKTAKEAEQLCSRTVYEADGYRVCWQLKE